MRTTWIAGALARDLRALRRELEAYPDERDLWRAAPGIVNTAGTLALHLAGNLQHFVGTVLGGTGYVRDRDAEFNRRDVPRAELLREIDATLAAVEKTLSRLPDEALAKPYPQPVAGVTLATGDFLMHLCIHCGWHLGQLDYHRRMVTGQGGQIRAVLPSELASAKPQ
jgi:uncharacterized damage-inducible protein DinB